jgi:hypothetical protein
VRQALATLHRELLQSQRIRAERFAGRMTNAELLQAATEDLRFAWLAPISQTLANLDRALAEGDTAAEAEAMEDLRGLLAPPDAESSFGARYLRALQDHPEVVLAHGALMSALEPGGGDTAARRR